MIATPMADLYLVLLHHPVLDKNGQIVTTALTNMDIHDIARSARTYGVRGFYVATPVRALRVLAGAPGVAPEKEERQEPGEEEHERLLRQTNVVESLKRPFI